MATVGSISIGFDAELGGLKAGVESVVASLKSVGDAADALSKQLSGLSSSTFTISVDTSSLGAATKSVEDLKTEVESSKKEFEEAGKGAEVLEKAVEATGKAAEEASKKVESIAQDVRAALSASGEEALKGTEKYVGMKDAISTLGTTATGSLRAVEGASNAAGNAAGGLASAINSISSGDSLGKVADSSIVAAGRMVVAYTAVSKIFGEILPASLGGVGTAISDFTARLGGLGAVTDAFRGNALAAAIVTASLAGIVASTGAAIATYAGIMAIARAATAGLSEEAQGYVQAGASFVGALAAGAVSAKVASVAYREVRNALLTSSTASGAAVASFVGLRTAIEAAIGPARVVVSLLALVKENLDLASSAATGSSAGFAAVAAKLVVTRAAIGAATGAVGAFVGGTSLMAGATAGAAAALSTMVSLFPVYAGVATLAAVATGRVEKQLRQLGSQFQEISNLADRFGKPTQEIEKLQIAAQNAGVAFGAVVKGQQTFASNLEKVKVGNLGSVAAREAASAFNDLGLSADRLRTLNPESAMREVAAALSGVEDATKRTQLAMDIFGKTGPALLPLLKNLKEVEADMGRLGGTTSSIDVERFNSLSSSFDRLRQGSAALSQNLLLPFTRMQEAVNNAMAEIQGGLAPVFNALGGIIVQATTPLAVMIEMLGRVLGIAGRLIGVIANLATAFLPLGMIASIAEGIRDGFMSAMEPIEQLVSFLESVASTITSYLGGTSAIFTTIGEAIGFVVGGLVQLATYVAIGAGVWAIYSAAVAVASGFSIAATVSFIAMWLAALGPVGLVIAALAAVGAAVALLTAGVVALFNWFFGWDEAKDQIDGATASVDDLASAVAEAESSSAKNGIEDAMLAVGEAASGAVDEVGEALGFSEEQIENFKNSVGSAVSAVASLVGIDLSGGEGEGDRFEKARASIEGARDAMADFSIRAAQLGTAGADAIAESSGEFNKLQRELAAGKITLEQFEESNAALQDKLQKNLDEIAKGSPEETLKKNLEVFKQMDDSAKAVAKSVRDIGAGVQIGDKFFPRSDEVKSRAQAYATEYSDALEEIKKKLATGGFQQEIDAQREELKRSKDAGEIDEETFKKKSIELDKTSAQEQATIAAEEVQRELDRKQASLKIELDFADNIRKRLEEAFLSPVDKFQKELEKIKTNIDLTDEEKALAEQDLRKTAREQIIGKSPIESFDDRQRDLKQAADAGLITGDEMRNKMLQNLDDLAEALGVPVNPANQMEVAVSQLDAALKAGKISVEQHADGLRAARRSFLESLGIKPRAEELDSERMAALEKQLKDGNISKEEFEQGRQAAEDDIVGQSAASRIAEQRSRIEAGIASGTVNRGRGEAAIRSLDADRRSAAGVEDTAAQSLQLGVDKINDAFGVAGKSIAEIQATLSPEEFAEYQKALENNTKSIRESLGVEESIGSRLNESRQRLDEAVKAGIITQEEANDAFKKQRDEVLSSLGIEKSPIEAFEEATKRLAEAAGENVINFEELGRGAAKAREALLSSLGVPISPIEQLAEKTKNLDDAFAKGLITNQEYTRGLEEARKALPGGEAESPLQQFNRDLETINDALARGLIDQGDAENRRQNIRAELQENLKPALDSVSPDRRLATGADTRSKSGVDTFFRILQGRDNPSLKAQQEIARNTRILAEAEQQPEAQAVIAQLAAR